MCKVANLGGIVKLVIRSRWEEGRRALSFRGETPMDLNSLNERQDMVR